MDSAQLDTLGTSENIGQSILGSLMSNPDSLARRLDELSEQLERNQLASSTLANEVNRLREATAELGQKQLRPALQDLNAAARTLQASEGKTKPGLDQLSKAVTAHRQATDQLQRLVDSAAVSESLADIQKQIQELLSEQAAVTGETQRLQMDAVVKGSSAQVAAKAGIHSDQQNLARRVEELAVRLQQELQATDAASPDPQIKKLIQDARHQLTDQPIASTMRQAAELVQSERLSEALKAQREVQDWLEAVANNVGGRAQGGLQSSSESMQALATQLDNLSKTQQQLAQSMQGADRPDAPNKSELGEQQQQLSSSVESLASSANVQASAALHEQLDRASQTASKAATQAAQNKLDEAAKSAQSAAAALEQAAETARQKADQLQGQIAEQRLLDLHTLLVAAIKQHAPVVKTLAGAVTPSEPQGASPGSPGTDPPTNNTESPTGASACGRVEPGLAPFG